MPTCEGGYKAFKIGELFDVEETWIYGKNKQYQTRLSTQIAGAIPVVSGITTNNGINYYTTDTLSKDEIFQDSLTISTRGEYSGTITFHDGKFCLANNILVMQTPPIWSKRAKLYLATIISKLGYGGYNNYPRKETLKERYISLPTTSTGAIDFAFMEQWVRGLEEERMCKLKAYLQAAGFGDCTLDKHEYEVLQSLMGGVIRSKKVKASELFEIKGNPQLNKESFVFGEQSSYPYFTRTLFNNGILGYVNYLDDSHLIKGNSLAVGMMGMQFFYMQHDFYAGQFTKTAFPKFNALNEHIALYFITQLNKMKNVYLSVLVRDFEKVFNDTELSLPVMANGDIDYAFMETAIRAMEKQCIARLKEALMHEQEVYRQVIR